MYIVSSHQVAIKTIWLHFGGFVMSFTTCNSKQFSVVFIFQGTFCYRFIDILQFCFDATKNTVSLK